MNHSLVKQRYAKSLLDLALDLNQVEEVKEDMLTLIKAAEETHELKVMLRSPVIKPDDKVTILSKVFEGKVCTLTHQFMVLLAKKKREELLLEIGATYLTLYKIHKGIKTAYLTTSKELSPETRERVLARLTSQTGAQIELIESVDPDIIGGFVLRVDDKQIDASMRGELKTIAREFDENPYLKAF